MKKILILFFVFLSTEINFAQTNENNELSEAVISYDSVEVKPELKGYPGGFLNFVGKNYRFPENIRLNGKIQVQFVIEKDGSVSNVKVLNDLGHGTGREAFRLLKKCPKWIPGKQNGEIVRVLYSFPINISS